MACQCETRREESLTLLTEAKVDKLIGRIAALPVQVRKTRMIAGEVYKTPSVSSFVQSYFLSLEVLKL